MALEIRFRKDKDGKVIYGEETCIREGVRGKTLHVVADVYDGEDIVATRLIQGITSEADRDKKGQAILEAFEEGVPAPVVDGPPDPTGWKPTLVKAVKEIL